MENSNSISETTKNHGLLLQVPFTFAGKESVARLQNQKCLKRSEAQRCRQSQSMLPKRFGSSHAWPYQRTWVWKDSKLDGAEPFTSLPVEVCIPFEDTNVCEDKPLGVWLFFLCEPV